MDYLQALEVACRLDQAGEHLLVRAVGFPPVQVGGYPRTQAVAYQRELEGDYLLVRVAVSPRDLVAVFLQGLVVVFQLVREVECRPVQRRI